MNQILLSVPITVLNIDSVSEGSVRLLSFVIRSGDDRLWTATHEVVIGEPLTVADVGAVQSPKIKKVTLVRMKGSTVLGV